MKFHSSNRATSAIQNGMYIEGSLEERKFYHIFTRLMCLKIMRQRGRARTGKIQYIVVAVFREYVGY